MPPARASRGSTARPASWSVAVLALVGVARAQTGSVATGISSGVQLRGAPLQFPARSPRLEAHLQRLAERARRGEPAALEEVGDRLLEGRDVGRNVREGARYLARAGKAGRGGAALRLARLLARGDVGLAADPALAAAWFDRAVALEAEQARRLREDFSRDLGARQRAQVVRAFQQGQRVPRDLARARWWGRRAARR